MFRMPRLTLCRGCTGHESLLAPSKLLRDVFSLGHLSRGRFRSGSCVTPPLDELKSDVVERHRGHSLGADIACQLNFSRFADTDEM